LQDLRCSGADAPIVTPERSSPNVQAFTEATENATTSNLTPLPRSGFVLVAMERTRFAGGAAREMARWAVAVVIG
jgi:hypothetical protein